MKKIFSYDSGMGEAGNGEGFNDAKILVGTGGGPSPQSSWAVAAKRPR
jgi:hypothetical protein